MINFKDNDKAKINQIYKPPDGIQFDRRMVYRRYAIMRDGRGSLESDWQKWNKQYEADRPNRTSDDWQSNIIPPFTTTIVERSLAEIVDQTLQPQIVGRGPEDAIRARIMNYIKDYTWEIGDGDLELYASLKQALILGKTIWQEDYWQDKREVKVLKKFNLEKNEEEYVTKEVMDFDDVYGETINLIDFFIDPSARTINRGRYKANDCLRRYIMNYDTFQETFINSIFDQFRVAKLVKPGGDTNQYQFYIPNEQLDKENQVEVLFYYGRRPDKFIIVANDVVIRDNPLPWNHKQLPFAEGSDVPRLAGFWARGEPEILESIQDELTTLRRMRIDRQHMDIFKMFLVSNRETLDEDEAIVAPSRFMYVDDPKNSIVPLEYRDVGPNAYREEEALKQDGREVTGMESPRPTGTATEAAIFKESTMKALRLKIWLLSRELLTNIIRLRVPNIVQYYSVPKVSQIVGEKKMAEYRQIRTTDVELATTRDGELLEKEKKGQFFFTIKPELIIPQYGAYDYKLSGEPTFPISKPLQQQKISEFMQHPVTQLAIQLGYYDPGRMADALSEIHDYDPEKFKPPAKEGEPAVSEEVLYEIANRENEAMLAGQAIPPTPYATRGHTEIHLAYMSSQNFKEKMTDQVMNKFIRHILMEEKAQTARGQAAQQGGLAPSGSPPSGQPPTEAQAIEGGEAKAAMPGRMMGPEMMKAGPPGKAAI
jgi:hypothetical protein